MKRKLISAVVALVYIVQLFAFTTMIQAANYTQPTSSGLTQNDNCQDVSALYEASSHVVASKVASEFGGDDVYVRNGWSGGKDYIKYNTTETIIGFTVKTSMFNAFDSKDNDFIFSLSEDDTTYDVVSASSMKIERSTLNDEYDACTYTLVGTNKAYKYLKITYNTFNYYPWNPYVKFYKDAAICDVTITMEDSSMPFEYDCMKIEDELVKNALKADTIEVSGSGTLKYLTALATRYKGDSSRVKPSTSATLTYNVAADEQIMGIKVWGFNNSPAVTLSTGTTPIPAQTNIYNNGAYTKEFVVFANSMPANTQSISINLTNKDEIGLVVIEYAKKGILVSKDKILAGKFQKSFLNLGSNDTNVSVLKQETLANSNIEVQTFQKNVVAAQNEVATFTFKDYSKVELFMFEDFTNFKLLDSTKKDVTIDAEISVDEANIIVKTDTIPQDLQFVMINDENNPVWAKKITALNNGSATFKIPANITKGDYKIVLTALDATAVKKDVFYAPLKDRQALLKKIADEANKTNIVNIISDDSAANMYTRILKAMGWMAEDFVALGSGQEAIAEKLIPIAADKLGQEFNELCIVNYMKEALPANVVQRIAHIKEFGFKVSRPEIETLYTQNNDDTILNKFILEKAVYTTYDELVDQYEKGILLTSMNKAQSTDVNDLIVKYYKDYDITDNEMAEYNNLSDYTLRGLWSTLEVYNLEDPKQVGEELRKVIEDKYNQKDNDNDNKGGGVGGGKKPEKEDYYDVGAIEEDADVTNPGVVESSAYYLDLGTVPWAQEYIDYLTARGVLKGDGNDKFRPNDYVSREEFVQMIISAVGIKGYAECEYSDVEYGKWYYNSIALATKYGIVSGMGESVFGITSPIKREEMALIVRNTADVVDLVLTNEQEGNTADFDKVSTWAQDAVAELYRAGMVRGNDEGMFMPRKNLTRAEAACVIYEVYVRLVERNAEI